MQPINLSAWLTLYNAPQVGPALFSRLLKYIGTPQQILRASTKQLKAQGLSELSIAAFRKPDCQLIEEQCEWAMRPKQYIITLQDETYPPLLKEIDNPPPLLFVKGEPCWLAEPQLAMVGTRNPSPNGIKMASQLAMELGGLGVCITSGLAIGIDAASHRGALAVQARTIAVLGSGLDNIYPVRHRHLAEQMIEHGALISEFSPKTPPFAYNFPRRNRIISGLSLGTVVVEATLRSGSLITAQYAAEQGREVFAMPGSVYHPLAQGCHYLIQQGAKLTTKVSDIIEEIELLRKFSQQCCIIEPVICQNSGSTLDKAHNKLLQCVGFEPTPVDQIVRRSGLTLQIVTAMLLELELKRYVMQVIGGYVRLGGKGNEK